MEAIDLTGRQTDEKKLTRVEREIMNILWERGEAMCASEIAEASGSLLRTTVTPTLGRLQRAGIITVDHIGRSKNVLVRKFRPVLTIQEYYARSRNEDNIDIEDTLRAYVWSSDDPSEWEARISEVREILKALEGQNTDASAK